MLASYNPETGTTARKQTGSFYTPREIVNYMVDESLIAYLESQLNASDDDRLRELFAYTDEPHRFSDTEVDELISAIDNIKILDPACGSGAFPMGVLHKLVFILGKLDPHNQRWKAKQISRAYEIPDSTIREKAISDIEEAFERNELDYGRKLYLIENCIYGVDIQPIAVQISKLRFFISLIVDQKIDDIQPNRGILPLPNLATKFVAANTLIGIDKNKQQNFQIPKIKKLEEELGKVRRDHFTARTTRTKNRCRERDREIRREISEVLKSGGFPSDTAEKLANWGPYDQNASSDFFDPEWMFGVRGGFDVVIGNPPYGANLGKDLDLYIKLFPNSTNGIRDIYKLFIEKGLKDICKGSAHLCYIIPNTILTQTKYKDIRSFLLNYKIERIVNLGDGVFEQVVPTCVIHVVKATPKSTKILFTDLTAKSIFSGSLSNMPTKKISQRTLNETPDNIFVDSFRKQKKDEVALGDIMLCKDAGIQYAAPGVGRLNKGKARLGERLLYKGLKKENSRDIELIVGKNISRYHIVQQSHNFLRWNYDSIIDKDSGEWFHFTAEIFNAPERIVWRQTADHIIATYDTSRKWFKKSVHAGVFVKGKENEFSYKYVLGLLNSKYMNFIYRELAREAGRTFPQVKVTKIRLLPIKVVSIDEQTPFIQLVDQILSAKKANPNADTTSLEQEIDQLVYELYDLTAEEISIVEEATTSATIDEININTASPAELALLDGVGNKTAELIIANRPYQEVEDLLKVRGIGEKTLEGIRDQIALQ